MKRLQCESKELDIFLSNKVLEKKDILLNGSMAKNHISSRTGFRFPAIRRISFLLWFQACQRVRPRVLINQLHRHLQDKRVFILHFHQARLRHRQEHIKWKWDPRTRRSNWKWHFSSVSVNKFWRQIGATRCQPSQSKYTKPIKRNPR